MTKDELKELAAAVERQVSPVPGAYTRYLIAKADENTSRARYNDASAEDTKLCASIRQEEHRNRMREQKT